MDIPILYEDKDVLVINKPAGLIVHDDGRTEEPTLVDWILKKYPKIKNVGESSELSNGETIIRPGIIHRLDRDTSGALVVAKNQKTFLHLKEQFQERKIEKNYRVFVYGEMKLNEGIIDRPITRSRSDFRLWSAQRGGQGIGRDAVTEYKVLGRHDGFSFVEVYPKTGRTHQIRVHFKAINYPVVCDKLYAPKRDCALGFKRLALHSFSMAFTLPAGKSIKVGAPYPTDFINALKSFSMNLNLEY